MRAHAEHKLNAPYGGLAVEMAIDFVIMYLVMYTMIATLDHFYRGGVMHPAIDSPQSRELQLMVEQCKHGGVAECPVIEVLADHSKCEHNHN